MTVRASLSARVLTRLEECEQLEPDPWLRDDLRIAWSTVLYAERGEAHSHFWATYHVLRVSPDEVWPMIEARRMAMLGSHYEEFFGIGVSSPPKKPAQSASDETRQRTRAAAA